MPLSPEISEEMRPKHVGYGLPCANCRAYYPADLTECPICGCRERVPATEQPLLGLGRIMTSQMAMKDHCPPISVPGGSQWKGLVHS